MRLTEERLRHIEEQSVGTEMSYGVAALIRELEVVRAERDAALAEVERLRGWVTALEGQASEAASALNERQELRAERDAYRTALEDLVAAVDDKEIDAGVQEHGTVAAARALLSKQPKETQP